MNKKIMFSLIPVILLLTATTVMAHTESDPFVTDLMAGQNMDVGDVKVWNDGDNLYVKYVTEDGWCLTETHLHVATSLGDIPQKNGNPPPGQFDYQMEHDCETEYMYTISLTWGCDTELYIAAHAVVENCETEASSFSPELTWKRSSEEAVAVYPGYGAQWTKEQGFAIAFDPSAVVWDGGTGSQYFTGYSTTSDISWASWVCTQNPSGKSLTGTDLRRFQATFDITEGYSVTGGTLGSVNLGYEDVIPMNDNIYIFVNDELIFWGGTISVLDPARTHFLGMERRPTEPQHSHTPDFPETDGWYMSGTIPEVSSSLFVEGSNVLDVFAEEFWTGGGMHELGLTLQGEQTTCETETAWGDGLNFTGKNWAMYFEYQVQCEEIEWPEDGTAYIGYEDREAGDFDYNDFGMNMHVLETYQGGCLKIIDMDFESVEHKAGDKHDIHIKRTLDGSVSYTYSITRSTTAQGTETAGSGSGSGDFDIVLFDSQYFTAGDTVEIVVTVTGGCELYPSVTSPRWDVAANNNLFAYYDPWMNDRSIGNVERHINDWQAATTRLPTQGYDVPYIIVVPVTDWPAPNEAQTITGPHPNFDDYYRTHDSMYENWYI
jgi:hypothetical protein